MYPYYAGFHMGEKWQNNPKSGFLTGREVEQSERLSTLEYHSTPFPRLLFLISRRFPYYSVTAPFVFRGGSHNIPRVLFLYYKAVLLLLRDCSLLIPRLFPSYSVAVPFKRPTWYRQAIMRIGLVRTLAD
jgi:hypothetical protein